MTRIEFLKEQTISGANKCRRAPLPPLSVADQPYSLTERKALALKAIFDLMPVYVGEQELIVGTRTFYSPNPGNEDGHDCFAYGLHAAVPYISDEDVRRFGCNQSYFNRTHYTPDFSIVLSKGIDGILREAENHPNQATLFPLNREFLAGVSIAYRGLQGLILRYATEAEMLAGSAEGARREELYEISRICRKISHDKPDTFREAVQLLWFTHLGTIVESFEFINYGRLDVILQEYLGDTPRDEALEILSCLLLKMYDQADLVTSYLGKYAAQLVITLGGVLPNGESAVNDVTMLFLDAIDKVRLPEPEFNLRVHSSNPPAFLDRAAELTVTGCNFISYYNDDRFVESLQMAGLPAEYARSYGFDLCQDINIPGTGDFWIINSVSLAYALMAILGAKRDFPDFESLLEHLKSNVAATVASSVQTYNAAEEQLSLYATGQEEAYFDGILHHGKPVDRRHNSPMAPLPLMSALFHGCLENALDVAYEPYPLKEKGIFFGAAVEAVNSLAAIRKIVYEEQRYTLDEVYAACQRNFEGPEDGVLHSLLRTAPKWGNDDDYVDLIAKDLLEFSLRECQKYKTYLGGQVLGGIHQPHPVPNGRGLMATPDGRRAGAPIAVTLTPQSGTMKNGPTAALCSAAKINPNLVQWNYCVMVNYFSSVFRGNDGKETFKRLLSGYFAAGGMQHQPNVLDVAALKQAQLEPEKYKDLIVRLWGVSAHFVDLPKELQDEMIARFE